MAHRSTLRLAVIGAGWAGLAAAVRAREAGLEVSVFEMAAQAGGRARSTCIDGQSFDNGQHILIGAYRRSLALMRTVGVDPDTVLMRLPLAMPFPDGRGLRLPHGPPAIALLRGILGASGWGWRDRLALLQHALRWRVAGFRCPTESTVDELCAALPKAVRELLVDPLCVAALNTPAPRASAAVFLRVLHDALLGPRGSADLLLPRAPLNALLADRAAAWLEDRGTRWHARHRVGALQSDGSGWQVDRERFDAALLACTPLEAARLVDAVNPGWAATARAIEYDAIVTVTLVSNGTRLSAPMVALLESADAPAQFVFDQGALGMAPGRFVAVVSGAGRWLDRSLDQIGQLVQCQLLAAFPLGTWHEPPQVLKTLAEKRATFRCTPDLRRPAPQVAPGLYAAGDYVQGPYPATLEGAVLSAEAALSLCRSAFRHAESRQ